MDLEFKGTKSPWKIDKKVGVFNQGGLYQLPISGNDKKNRQVSNVFGVNESEGIANAKLIAASPDLLEALNQILNAPQPFNEKEFISWVETARIISKSALEKALK